MFKEFKEFAVKGNVVDMAVGIIIGGAFGTIVKSLVSDVLMPPIGPLMGGVDFSNMFIVLKAGEGGGSTSVAGRCKRSRGGYGKLWFVHKFDNQLSDCRLRGVSGHQADQQAEKGRRSSSCRSHNKRVPALLYRDSHKSRKMSQLHFSGKRMKVPAGSPRGILS